MFWPEICTDLQKLYINLESLYIFGTENLLLKLSDCDVYDVSHLVPRFLGLK